MTRIKRGILHTKKRRKLWKYAKGFKWGRKTKRRAIKEALLHAWTHAYAGRKEKKRNFRQLWNIQINAACRERGLSYSRFIDGLKKHKVELDRKILADIAQNEPEIFTKIIEMAKTSLA